MPTPDGAPTISVELTREEAEILIAVLTYAEGEALFNNPSIVEALKILRPWRSVLLQVYLRTFFAEAPRG